MLEEGINEAGSTCSWIAAATSYANHGIAMVPFYIYYSMFGFQRVGDFIWAAGDMRARGFLVGATAGRTTLAGEGLQHQDGHSQLVATTIPNCRAYDPTYAYELAVIIQDGMQRMYVENESVFYYISVMNENYRAAGAAGRRGSGHRQGRLPAAERRQGQAARDAAGQRHHPARVHRRSRAAGAAVRRYEPTCFRSPASANCGARRSSASAGICCIRRKLRACRMCRRCLAGAKGPLVAATDYVRNVPDQIRTWVSQSYVTLGTDGFGRSDARAQLRQHFEVDRNFIALAALKVTRRCQTHRSQNVVIAAVAKLGIDAEQGRSSQQLTPQGNSLGFERNLRARPGRLQGRGRH